MEGVNPPRPKRRRTDRENRKGTKTAKVVRKSEKIKGKEKVLDSTDDGGSPQKKPNFTQAKSEPQNEAKDEKDPPTESQSFTYEESLAIRRLARDMGLEGFLTTFTSNPSTSLSSLCHIFGALPTNNRGHPLTDRSELNKKLRSAIQNDMRNRIKLPHVNTPLDVLTLLRSAQKILVITGAGVSTSLDIPDFRSQGGLYPQLQAMGYSDPESIFSRDAFESDPAQFFSVAALLLPPGDGRFSRTHAFLKTLQDQGKLLRVYTQNIDGIDSAAGIKAGKLVELHGSFKTASCTVCARTVEGESVFGTIRDGKVPSCEVCMVEQEERQKKVEAARAKTGRPTRNRSAGTDLTAPATNGSVGIMRPDIVFMGDPPRPYLPRFERDCAAADLVLVIGSSLPVEPVKSMPNKVASGVPQVYIGRERMLTDGKGKRTVRRPEFDVQLLGECDVVTSWLGRECGWGNILGGRGGIKDENDEKVEVEVTEVEGLKHCHFVMKKYEVAKPEQDEQANAEGEDV